MLSIASSALTILMAQIEDLKKQVSALKTALSEKSRPRSRSVSRTRCSRSPTTELKKLGLPVNVPNLTKQEVGQPAEHSIVAAADCEPNRRLFTDRVTKWQFVVGTGSDICYLCCYSHCWLTYHRKPSDYELSAANESS